jgi:5-methylcytosine-specific restriction endonuclease McrBC GTP-binding regulatory subunit McrB
MIFEIVNTILLLCSLMLNIKILNIANNLQKNNIKNPSASLADIADMMSCDNCDARDDRDDRDGRKENNVSPQNIYKSGTDNENDNIKLLGNNRQDQSSHTDRREEQKEWTEIQISK